MLRRSIPVLSRSRKERSDSVTKLILDQRAAHEASLADIEISDEIASLASRLADSGLGIRRKARDGKVFDIRWKEGKQISHGFGAGGFAHYLGSASRDWPILKHQLPEVAIAGHTNCGKSSLVNALAGIHPRKGVARVSDRAGWTDFVSFYQLGKKPPVLTMVDLPGYGHAVASKSNKREWKRMIRSYLQERQLMCRCVVLVDSSRGLCDDDKSLLDFLERKGLEHQVVLTKADLMTPISLAQCITKVTGQLCGNQHLAGEVTAVCASTGAGCKSLWEDMRARSMLERTSLLRVQDLVAQRKREKEEGETPPE